jgi:hypothetical protein
MNKDSFFTGQPLFTQLLKYISRERIGRVARAQKSDHYYKKFDSYTHLVVMLFSGFQKCSSLRELITGLMAWQSRL